MAKARPKTENDKPAVAWTKNQLNGLTKKDLAELAVSKVHDLTIAAALRKTKTQLVELCLSGAPAPVIPKAEAEEVETSGQESQTVEVAAPQPNGIIELLQSASPILFGLLSTLRQDMNENTPKLRGVGILRLFKMALEMLNDCRVQNPIMLDSAVRLRSGMVARRIQVVLRRVVGSNLEASERGDLLLLEQMAWGQIEALNEAMAAMPKVEAHNHWASLMAEVKAAKDLNFQE